MSKKMSPLIKGLLGVGAALGATAMYYKGGTGKIVENFFPYPILIKPEDIKNGTVQILPPGSLIEGIDGVATGFLPGEVFKVPNRMNIRILADGNIEFVGLSGIDKVVREYASWGWQSRKSPWFKNLEKKGNKSWNDIIEFAEQKSSIQDGWKK